MAHLIQFVRRKKYRVLMFRLAESIGGLVRQVKHPSKNLFLPHVVRPNVVRAKVTDPDPGLHIRRARQKFLLRVDLFPIVENAQVENALPEREVPPQGGALVDPQHRGAVRQKPRHVRREEHEILVGEHERRRAKVFAPKEIGPGGSAAAAAAAAVLLLLRRPQVGQQSGQAEKAVVVDAQEVIKVVPLEEPPHLVEEPRGGTPVPPEVRGRDDGIGIGIGPSPSPILRPRRDAGSFFHEEPDLRFGRAPRHPGGTHPLAELLVRRFRADRNDESHARFLLLRLRLRGGCGCGCGSAAPRNVLRRLRGDDESKGRKGQKRQRRETSEGYK
mmetsp:Transcript_46606/g.141172  ORF Transcript_46606/g.141172 Transcript_46606/m.141172 type:complete len:330 (+) Transcript_46606:176-1165(+)